MKSYRVTLNPKDPTITLRLPAEMVKDLAKRSEENGRDLTVELILRLARTLENDLVMLEADKLLAAECQHFINKA